MKFYKIKIIKTLFIFFSQEIKKNPNLMFDFNYELHTKKIKNIKFNLYK